MSSSHDKLVEDARLAIAKVGADPAVPIATTKESLEALVEECEARISALDESDDEEAE